MFIYCHEPRTKQKTDAQNQTECYSKIEGDVAICLILLAMHDFFASGKKKYILQMCVNDRKNTVDGNYSMFFYGHSY